MQIGYWSFDETNLELARDWAEKTGAVVQQLFCRNGEKTQAMDAFLYDLDCWPAPDRQTLIARLLAAPPVQPVAVHGYNLDEATCQKLQTAGVLVFSRLEKDLIEQLRNAFVLALTVKPAPEPNKEMVLGLGIQS